MVSVTLGICAFHTIPSQFLTYYSQLIVFSSRNGIKLDIAINIHPLLYKSRNNAVEQALKNNSDYLFFLDVDIFPPPNTLIDLINKNKNIISGATFIRGYPYQPNAYKLKEDGFSYDLMKITKKEVVEVDAIGTGCMLINMNVIKTLEKPWFNCNLNGQKIGEDLYFCKKAKEKGFKIYYDNTIDGILHFGAAVGKKEFNKFQDEFVP